MGRPLLEWTRRRRVAGAIRVVAGSDARKAGPRDLVVCTLVRDGAIYVREFIDHYRRLGAARIVFLDTGSRDGTRELIAALADRDDVILVQTHLPYAGYRDALKNHLAQRFAGEGWALIADIDELFDFPLSADTTVGAFLQYLDEAGFSAVMVHMLDMFARESPADDGSGERFRETHRWFDPSGYSRVDALAHAGRHARGTTVPAGDGFRMRFGGVQRRAFGTDLLMSKMALFRPASGVWTSQDHFARGARLADVTGVFYHYKFAGDFRGRARRAVEMGSYHKGSTHYRNVVAALERDPGMRLLCDSSLELSRGTEQLVEIDFLVVSERFRQWGQSRAGSRGES